MSSNPLLHIPYEIPFHEIRPAHVLPAIETLIENAKGALSAIKNLEGSRTYENTLGALEDATVPLSTAMTVVGHLESVATTPDLRKAYTAAQPLAAAFWSTIPLDGELYDAIHTYAATDDAKALDPVRARLLEKTLRSFRRNGAELSPAKKEELTAIQVELTEKTTLFAQHVLDATNAFELIIEDESRLEGLPESAKNAAAASAKSKELSGYRFTLQAPSLIPVLTYLDDSAIRERLWRAYNTRATSGERDNRGLILEILKLRNRKAKLLGYEDFADFVLEERMAKSGGAAMSFVDELREKTLPFFQKENAALLSFQQATLNDAAATLNPWDVGYFAEKLRKERYDFDEEILRPYFKAESVLEGLFELAKELYGIEIEERKVSVWNEDVRFYSIQEGGKEIAGFYVDLHPREDKRGGAWMNALVYGPPHRGLFCANVTPPVGDRPALLTHREVETLFHEFGHLLHHALSEVEVSSLGGTNVAWDFVELPSQIMENFCWERVSLDFFAKHYETGETIPEELLQKLQASRTYRAAAAQMRQLGFGTVDLRLHRELDLDTATPDSVRAFARDVLAEHAVTDLPEDYGMICAFTHLFASPTAYASGYYSYKWAEVLDADAFTRFRENGVISKDIGHAFRSNVLAKGDSDDPETLFKNFMGRAPNLEALLERCGLTQDA